MEAKDFIVGKKYIIEWEDGSKTNDKVVEVEPTRVLLNSLDVDARNWVDISKIKSIKTKLF